MALELPDLAKKQFEEIFSDLVSSAPKYATSWDNHNPSDVGIILLELMSFVGENTLYRLNKISNTSYLHFLRLVTGAKNKKEVEDILDSNLRSTSFDNSDRAHRKILEFQLETETRNDNEKLSAQDIPRIKKAVLEFTTSRYRAITKTDYEELALEATEDKPDGSPEKVARAIILESKEKKGKIWIYVIAQSNFKYNPLRHTSFDSGSGASTAVDLSKFDYDVPWSTTRIEESIDFSTMILSVQNYIFPRKLIGTPVEVATPSFIKFKINMTVVFSSTPKAERGLVRIVDALQKFFDPVSGGETQSGWPYNRPVSIYEISQIIEGIPDVNHVKSLSVIDALGNQHNQLPVVGLARLDEMIITPVRDAEQNA